MQARNARPTAILEMSQHMAVVVLCCAACCTCGRAALVVLGDSYSDTGNGASVLVNDYLSTDQV